MEQLQKEYPESKQGLFEEDGTLRSFVRIYVNETEVLEKADYQAPLQETDRILLLPAIAGGAPVESVISDERRKQVALDDSEIERYHKHLMLREIGVKGQKRIKAAKVLVIGIGALGSSVLSYLAAAGIGTLGIVDFDEVSLSNLQSQVIHGTRDVLRPKTASARDSIKALNPKVKLEVITAKVEADNIEEIVRDYDIVVDCTDNYPSRYLINDACVQLGKPVVFGAMYQLEGQVSVFCTKEGPCFRCLFPSPPPAGLVPTCSEGGVISPLPGIIGSIQANEVLKLVIGKGECLIGKMLVLDSWNLPISILPVHKRESCLVCKKTDAAFAFQTFDYEAFCGLKQEEEEISVEVIEADELAARIERGEPLTIVDIREPNERAIHRFPNAIVIPIGQLVRRQKELDPEVDTVFICREGLRSVQAITVLREAGYQGGLYSLKGGIEAAKDIIFSHEGAWL